ncbi:MAG: DUF814 domain-containing protein [FCB group bacterium]|nr:DUF814 domain-containing protein [FCB group bacterium]
MTNQLKKEIVGANIVATEFYKKERAAYFFFKNKKRFALAFLYHPTHFGSFLIPASKVKIITNEKPWPIFNIIGAKILSVEQLGFDRLFKIIIQHQDKKQSILLEAIGPNGNILLLDENDLIVASLRKKGFKPGTVYQPFKIDNKLNPLTLNSSVITDHIKNLPDIPLVTFIEKNILGCHYSLAKEIETRSNVECESIKDISEKDWARIIQIINQIIESFKTETKAYLYQTNRGYEAYPFKLSSVAQQPERYKNLSLAVMASTEKRQQELSEEDIKKNTKDAIRRAVQRLEKRIAKIEKDIEEASAFEQYKKMGELLQINFHRLKKGMSHIAVEDVFDPSHKEIDIPLDSSLSPKANIEHYFKKYRKGREGLQLLQRRLTISREELKTLATIKNELDNNYEQAVQRYHSELMSLLPQEGIKKDLPRRLPYREYSLSTGLKILVGRDGSDNDRTTFEFAKPYELWFHAQQCPGSHLVMKFPHKSFVPSKYEIEEAAAIAAFFSKAKNDSLVPVIYTQKKYVRKPRKAKAGLVTVEREKSVMVAPKKPEKI